MQVRRIFQLAAYKAAQDAAGNIMTYDKLADLYSLKVKISSGEAVSRDYVGQALRIYNVILSDPQCRALIMQAGHLQRLSCKSCSSGRVLQCLAGGFACHCSGTPKPPLQAENTFGKRSCWESVTKLEALMKKATDGGRAPCKEKVLFQLQAVHCYCTSGLNSPSELSVAALAGKGRLGRGLLDVMLFKLELLADWLHNKSDSVGLFAADKLALRKHTASFATFQEAEQDPSWHTPMQKSGRMFAELVEALVLGSSGAEL